MSASFVPAGYAGVNLCLFYSDVEEALEHYKEAFHAVEVMRTHDDPLGYAEISISSCRVMLCHERYSWAAKTPDYVGSTTAHFYTYVENVEASHARALKAGATRGADIEHMPWGDVCGGIIDKFGYGWMLAQAAQPGWKSGE